MKVITMSYDNKRQTSTLYGSTCEVRGGTSEVLGSPRRKVRSIRSWHILVSNVNIDSVSNDFDIRGCVIEQGRNVGVHLSYLEHRSHRTDEKMRKLMHMKVSLTIAIIIGWHHALHLAERQST